MATLNTDEYASVPVLVEVYTDPETGETMQRTRLNQAARAGDNQQPQQDPYLGAPTVLSNEDYALIQTHAGPESQVSTVSGGSVFSINADLRQTWGDGPEGDVATGHEMWALSSAGAPIGPHSMQVEQTLDKSARSGAELSDFELANAHHLGSRDGQDAWEEGYETRRAAAPQAGVNTAGREAYDAAFPKVQSALGDGVPLPMTTLSPEGRSELKEANATFASMEGNSQPVLGEDAPTAIMVDGAQDLIEGPNRISSQAGLAAYNGGAIKSFASVPSPGEPGSRFNPRVVSREEQAARRSEAQGLAGRGTKVFGEISDQRTGAPSSPGVIGVPRGTKTAPIKAISPQPKKASHAAPGKASEKPAPSMMEQMMTEMKQGTSKGVGASFAQGMAMGVGQRMGQRGQGISDPESETDSELEELTPAGLISDIRRDQYDRGLALDARRLALGGLRGKAARMETSSLMNADAALGFERQQINDFEQEIGSVGMLNWKFDVKNGMVTGAQPGQVSDPAMMAAYGGGPSMYAGPGSPVPDFTGPSSAPTAAAQPMITEVPASIKKPSAVVNHLGQSREELAPVLAQGAIGSKVVMNASHVAALETMDNNEAAREADGRQESSGGGYQR